MRRAIGYSALVLCVVVIGSVLWAGSHLTRGAQRPVGAPPPDLAAVEYTLHTASGDKVSTWFVPGKPGRGGVLLLHAIRADKRAMIPRARFLRRAGYAVMLIDLPAHGESTGRHITFGMREASGVTAATQKLRELIPNEKLGLIGASLGAAAAVFSAEHPAYSVLVLESLYPTIEDAVGNRLRLRFGSVGALLTPLLTAQLESRIGISASELRPIDRMRDLQNPVLLVHGTEDRHTTLVAAEQMFAATSSSKELFLVQGAAHVDLHAFAGPAYEQRVLEILARHLHWG